MPQSRVIPTRLKILQWIDRSAGAQLIGYVRPQARALREAATIGAPLDPRDVRRILVIRPGGMGDAVLTWPMMHALRAAFPAARLEVLAERRNAAVYGLNAQPIEVLCYDRESLHSWRALHAEPYDLIIDTEQYHYLSTLLANSLAPRWVCGFGTLGRSRLQTHPVAHSEDDYEVLSFLRLAEAVMGTPQTFDPQRPFIQVSAENRDWARHALRTANTRRIAALIPGAGSDYRLWPPERYAQVVQWLAARGFFIAVLGGDDSRAVAAAITRDLPEATTDLTCRTSLVQTAAILAQATFAISTDTGVLHVAFGVGTPTVSLFGPGLHRKWAPPGARHRTVRLGLRCSPCTRMGVTPACPYDVACMRDLGVEDVLRAVKELAGV